MAIEITMPQLSDTMDEGTILSWLKQVGDSVSRGDALAEVATDKADLEIESFHEGTLLKIHSPEGTTVKVGSVIAVIGEAGESVADTSSSPTTPAPAQNTQPAPTATAIPPAQPVASTPAPTPQVQATQVTPMSNGSMENNRVKISPLAKNLAQAHGVDYTALQGSGDGGRIVKRDVESQLGHGFSPAEVEQVIQSGQAIAAAASSQPASAPAAPVPQAAVNTAVASTASGVESREVLSKMRQTIAQRMVESVNSAPHFYATTKIKVDALIAFRKTLKPLPQYEGLTFNHLVIKAAGMALAKYPRINSAYADGAIVQPAAVNVGIITALPDGLLIPILKNADSLTLADIVQEANGLVHRARSGRPKSEDLQGGTFSISNIGKADVESFTAIINPGQGAILAVSSMQEEPVVVEGALSVGTTMRLTLSVDHRIIDGVVAGQFVTELKHLLEEPVLLLA